MVSLLQPAHLRQVIGRLSVSALASVGGLSQAENTQPSAFDRLEQACVFEMVRSTCRVTVGQGVAGASGADDTVFIAGVGRIDARSYRELLDSGQAMCSLALRRCRLDWNGAVCQAARALWGLSSQTGPAPEPAPTR